MKRNRLDETALVPSAPSVSSLKVGRQIDVALLNLLEQRSDSPIGSVQNSISKSIWALLSVKVIVLIVREVD